MRAEIRNQLATLVSQMTLAEINELATQFDDDDLINMAMFEKNMPTGKRSSKAVQDPASGSGAFNLRTSEGKVAFFEALLKVLRASKDKMKGKEIREALGNGVKGNALGKQLNALIDSGHVAYEGERSGTVYWITAKGKKAQAEDLVS